MFGLPAAHKGAVIYGAWRCGAAPPDTSQRAESVGLPGPKLPSFPKSRTEKYSPAFPESLPERPPTA